MVSLDPTRAWSAKNLKIEPETVQGGVHPEGV